MINDIEKILSKSAEVNVLLNSNMEDVLESAKETRDICSNIQGNITGSLNEIVNESKITLTSISKETNRMVSENKANNKEVKEFLSQANEKSIKDVKENFDNSQKLINSYFAELGGLLHESKDFTRNEFEKVIASNKENKKSIIDLHNKSQQKFNDIEVKVQIVKENTDSLKKFVEVKFNELNEVIINEAKRTRKLQTIYFIIAIILLLILIVR